MTDFSNFARYSQQPKNPFDPGYVGLWDVKPEGVKQPEVELSPALRLMFDRERMAESRALIEQLRAMPEQDVEQMAEAEGLSIELGLDAETVRGNIKNARRLLSVQQMEDAKMAENYPILWRQMQDPTFAALALDDFDKLSWLERWSAGWESANIMEELSAAANKLRAQGGLFRTEAERENYMRLTKRMEDLGHVDGFWGMTGQTISQMAIWETGVAIGASIGAAFVPPAAPALVPIAIGLAGAAPAAYHTYELEGGLAYQQYKAAGLAEDVARRNSHTAGLINAAIEMGTLAFFAKPFGAATRNLANRTGLTRRLLGNALDSRTATRAWRKTAGRSLMSLGSEVGQEVSQEDVTALFEYFGKKETEARDQMNEVLSNAVINMPGGGRVVKEDGKVRVTPDVFKRVTGRPVEFLDSDGMITLEGDVAKRMLEDVREIFPIETALNDETFWSDMWELSIGTAKQAIMGVGLVSQFGPTLQHFSEMKRVRHAAEQQTAYQEVKENLKDSKLRQRSSSRMVMLLRKHWRGTKMGEVHIPREEFTKALDETGLTVEEVEEVFPGLTEQLDKSEEQQPTVVLDGAKFFGEVAETELQDRLFEHIKPSANDYTIAESKAMKERIDAEAKRLREGMKAADGLRSQVETDADELFEKLTQNALDAGVRNKQIARDSAALAVAGLRVRAEQASASKGTLVLPSQLLGELGYDADKLIIAKPEDYDTKTVFRQFAGTRSDTADMPAFKQAVQMSEDGASAEEIRKTTGWFVGPDGQPRYEITDENAKWTSVMEGDARVLMMREATDATTSTVTLADVLDHPELFAAYPELRKVKLEFYDGPVDDRGWANDDQIGLNKSAKINDAERMSTLLHEVQHVIQGLEGFATGSTPVYFEGRYIEGGSRGLLAKAQLMTGLANSVDERLAKAEAAGEQALTPEEKQALKDAIALPALRKMTALQLVKAQERLLGLVKSRGNPQSEVDAIEAEVQRLEAQLAAQQSRLADAQRLAPGPVPKTGTPKEVRRILREAEEVSRLDNFQLYQRTAGEAEARATQARQGMTAEERRETAVDRTFADDQLTRTQLVFRVGEPGAGLLATSLKLDAEATPATSTKFRQGGKTRELKPGARVESGNKLGFWPKLRVRLFGRVKLPKKPSIGQATTNKNAAAQLAAVDAILAAHPDAHTSQEAWARMQAEAFASAEVPVPPYAFIRDLVGSRMADNLRRLSVGQIEDAAHGFENAALFRKLYTEGEIDVETTGKLFLWSFLSRGVSPYTQESLFIDAFKGAEKWIAKAAAGKFTAKDVAAYTKWAKSVAPKGSGMPGASSTHNLNAFGGSFLLKLSKKDKDGVTGLQKLHDMMSDPQQTGRQIRRRFAEMSEGVGIDNKVVSFTLLVAGFTDVMVLDRVQVRQLWDDGRFNGYNLYDGVKTKRIVKGKEKQVAITGSALTDLTMGARGILIYEAVERALDAKVQEIYTELGRPQDASVGRYHWESWVADSEQEASHGTLDSILEDVKGADNAIAGVVAKQGEYATYEYGAGYFVSPDGVSGFVYNGPSGKQYTFDVPTFRGFLDAIKKPKNGVVPRGTKTKDPKSGKTKTKNWSITENTEGLGGPWWSHPDINQEQLDKLAAKWSGPDGRRLVEEAVRLKGAEDAVRPVSDDPSLLRQQGEEEAPRGQFDPESMQIILLQDHDATTMVHELAHFFFELDTQMALAGVASPQQLRDMETILDELGEGEFSSLDDYLTSDVEKRRKLHEKVAYNFETYMYEGKAPNAALKDVFRRMSTWMVRIYRQVRDAIAANYYAETMDPATGKGDQLPALTDDVRNVFDRWLAADEEIEIRIREEAIGRLLRADQTDDLDELDKILLQEIVFEHEHEAKEKLREVLLSELKKLRTMRGRMVRKAQRDSRAERQKREAEERQRIASGDRLGRLLHFMSTGELLNADGTVDRSSLQARLEGALNRLYLLMKEQTANKQELADRQSELDATITDSATQIADQRKGIAEVRAGLRLLRKAGGDQSTRIDESLDYIRTAESKIEGLEKARKAAREELKAMRGEIKRVDKAIEKAKKSVAVAQRGAEGVKGKRLRMFLTDDPRVPEQYRTTDPDKAEIVDVERFARQNGFGSADVMFDAMRRQMIGEKKQAVEVEAGGVKYRLPGDPAGEALQDMVNDRTDERMLAEVPHLADPAQMQFEIDAAMTNEAIIRLRAAELRMMEKQPLSERRRMQEMVRVAREVARVDVGKLTTRELFGRKNLVRKFTQQAQASERLAAANRGDVEAMAKHQRTALYFRAMSEQAVAAREAIEKHSNKLQKRMRFQPNNRNHENQLARSYGGAVVETARQMLDMIGVEVGSGVRNQGPAWQDLPEDSPERQMLEQADSDMRMVVATDGQLMDQSVEQAMESLEYVEGVLIQGKWARTFELEGKAAELDDVIRQLREQVEAEMTPKRSRKAPSTVRERVKGKIRQWNYGTQRAEQLLYALDGDKQGLLSQLIFVPLRNAEDQVEIHLAAVIEKLAPLLQTVRDEVGSNRALSQPITTGVDATGAPLLPDRSASTQDADVLENGKLDVLGMLLHCGNESNLRRLLLGFGWAELRPDGSINSARWWEQVRQWEDAGVITAADWEFCQGVWDIYEDELLPMTQQAHVDMLGRRMSLVDKGMPILKTRTMADGTVVNVAGGYVPAGRDPQLRSPKGERNEQDTLLNFQRSIATINKGHTKDRVDEDAPDPLDINPINQILHFRQSIIFAQMGPAHKKVATVLRNNEFAELLERMAPGVFKNVLDPLMETAATLSSTLVAARGADMLDGLDFVDKLRSNYGSAAMFANVVNSMQGVTGVLLAGMSGQVQARFLLEGVSGGHTKAEIYKASPFMAARHKLGVSAFEMQQQVLSLVETGKFQSVKEAQRWLARNTYWMQEIIQHPVDIIVWRGAYAQAIAEGKPERVAVNAADGAVRRTQADTAVTSMAKVEKGGRFAKMWTQFLSWFLSLGSMRASAMRSATLKKREDDGTRAMWVLRVVMSKQAMAGLFTLYVGELIATAFRGEDEEKDELQTWLVDPLLMTALALPRALGPVGAFGATLAAQSIPLVVPSLSRDLEYQGRMPEPGAIAIMNRLSYTAKNLLAKDADRTDVLETLELAAKMLGIPVHVLTQRLRRGFNIFDEEKFEPQGVSAITGRR